MKRLTCTRVILACIVLFGACGAGLSQPIRQEAVPITVANLCEDPTRYAGQVVKLEGVFQGWRASECDFPACASGPITRSDWLIQTGADCLYVTGGMPADLDPLNSDSFGRRMELQATVEVKEDGKVYLKYISSRSLGP